MKSLVFASGKGGTGKTTLTALVAHLLDGASVAVADCDVEASNLPIALHANVTHREAFSGGGVAVVDPDICRGCGACVRACRFGAVVRPTGTENAYRIDAWACEGCSACVPVCPYGAISVVSREAGEVFAEKGYRDATIAEICAKAEANIAAVNYHFRDKESLYREAWRQSLMESLKAHPPDGGVSPDAAPEDRLRGQINALLERVSDKDNKELSIMQKEMASPTGLLEEVIRKEIQPLGARIETIIRELMGADASDSQIKFCGISIFSQCINPAVIRSGEERHRQQEHGSPRVEDIVAYTDHVITFSLGGIRALIDKQNSQSGQTP